MQTPYIYRLTARTCGPWLLQRRRTAAKSPWNVFAYSDTLVSGRSLIFHPCIPVYTGRRKNLGSCFQSPHHPKLGPCTHEAFWRTPLKRKQPSKLPRPSPTHLQPWGLPGLSCADCQPSRDALRAARVDSFRRSKTKTPKLRFQILLG